MTFKINNDKTAAVSLDTFWKPVDANTPNGVKMLVINKQMGVAHVSIFRREDGWTHFYPLPRFIKDSGYRITQSMVSKLERSSCTT